MRRGFTIVELITVVFILALLLGMAALSLSGVRAAGRGARCRAQMRHMAPWNAIALWRSIEGDEVMFFQVEKATNPSATIVANLAESQDWQGRKHLGGRFKPTSPMVERLFDMHGIKYEPIDWLQAGVSNWTELGDYKRRVRVSYVASPGPVRP